MTDNRRDPDDNQATARKWEKEVSSEFHQLLNGIRSNEPPSDGMSSFLKAASSQHEGRVSIDEQTSANHTSLVAPFAALALTVLLLASFFLLAPSTGLAQVAKAVAEKPWMRLTLQEPDFELPDDEKVHLENGKFPLVSFWIRGDKKVFASVNPDRILWADLIAQEKWAFERKDASLKRSKLNELEGSYVTTMTALLTELGAPKGKLPTHEAADRVKSIEKRNVKQDGMDWDLYVFEMKNKSAPQYSHQLELRVDPTTNRPVELKRWLIENGQKSKFFATFAIDYPRSGAEDIYALGAPRDTKVDDIRSLAKYFAAQEVVQPGNYEAILIRTMPKKEISWIFEGYRYRTMGDTSTVEIADLMAIHNLRTSVYNGERGDKSPPAKWWAEEIDRLAMEHRKPSQFPPPHFRLHIGSNNSQTGGRYGSESQYASVHSETKLEGLIGSLELRGPRQSIWIDPSRDNIVLRHEFPAGSNDKYGGVSVRQVDEVKKLVNGAWVPIRWRDGRVSKRGEALSDNSQGGDGVKTTLWIAVYKFLDDK